MHSKSVLPAVVAILAMLSTTAACPAGSAVHGDVCAFCPPGSFALAEDVACTPCDPGFWAPINSVSPDACYSITARMAAQEAARTNRPHPDRDEDNKGSDSGSSSAYDESTSGVPATGCDAGSAPAGDMCAFCPPGTFALAASSACTPCSNGCWAPVNSVSPDACYPIAPVSMMSKAKPVPIHCDAGSAPVKGVCTFCPVGTYALAGATQCTHCATGFWAPINSVSPDACYPLPRGASMTAEAAKPGVHCDAGSAPVKGVCTFCPVGTYALAGAPDCTACPKGQWAPINSVSKDACYPPAAGADHCDAGSAPVNGVCTFCPKGTYSLAAAKKCTACPEDHTSPANSVSKDTCYLE